MPGLMNVVVASRSGLINAFGSGQAWTCQCPWVRTGLDLSMVLGPGRPGLVNALGSGQAWTCHWSCGRAGLDLFGRDLVTSEKYVGIKGMNLYW